jgi:hypothetical protein
LATLYGATNIEEPPPRTVQVGYSWASTVDLNVLENGDDTVSATIAIPEGYIPSTAKVTFTGLNEYDQYWMFVAIGGQVIVDANCKSAQETPLVPLITSPAPQGLPVSIRVNGHFDRTAVLNVRVDCTRTEGAMNSWRLKVFEAIKEAHDFMQGDYDRKVAQAEIKSGAAITGRNPDENRAIEIVELERWAIQIMRRCPFNFDGVSNFIENAVGYQEVDPEKSKRFAEKALFFKEAMEWRQMSYFLYPYYWGRRDTWGYRRNLQDPDPIHQNFLQAGGARVIVPVTPRYEERVLHYLSTPEENEMDRVRWIPPKDKEDTDYQDMIAKSEAEDVWLEVLINKNTDFQRGSGTLSVKKGDAVVAINLDSMWIPDARDLERELYIGGELYSVVEIVKSTKEERQIRLDRPYELSDNTCASYATDSVLVGTPWRVRIPTTLVILSEEKEKLKI